MRQAGHWGGVMPGRRHIAGADAVFHIPPAIQGERGATRGLRARCERANRDAAANQPENCFQRNHAPLLEEDPYA